MSIPARRKKVKRVDKSALQILEESFHLLRVIDLSYFWVFFLGAIPFVIGLLYFAADMGRSSLADQSVFFSTSVMVVLYLWLRATQAFFCRGLWKTIQPESEILKTRGAVFRQLSALFLIQAFQIPLLTIGLILALPLGWIVAFLQNATVLSLTRTSSEGSLRTLWGESVKYSHRDWAQNHGILLILAFVVFFTWVNIVGTCLILATFAKSFFGVESVFTISPMAAILNSTFALGTLLLTYLVMSPIMKAVYTLRCFYGQSRTTGEDLLSRLAAHRQQNEQEEAGGLLGNRAGRAATIGFLILFGGWASPQSLTAEEAGSSGEPDLLTLEESIAGTLTQKKYQWQLSRRVDDVAIEDSERGWLAQQMHELAASLREMAKDFTEWIEEYFERLERQQRRDFNPDEKDGPMLQGLSSALSIGLIVIVAGLAAWLALVIYRKYRNSEVEVSEEGAVSEVMDLQREDIVATELPEDEWMKLAREQIAKGDGRLAVRALFLASLSNLGDEELIKVARFKSNRDYRRELLRRARKWEELNVAFQQNIGLFERAWYGWHEVTEETVETYLKNHEMIVEQSGKAGKGRFVAAGGALTN